MTRVVWVMWSKIFHTFQDMRWSHHNPIVFCKVLKVCGGKSANSKLILSSADVIAHVVLEYPCALLLWRGNVSISFFYAQPIVSLFAVGRQSSSFSAASSLTTEHNSIDNIISVNTTIIAMSSSWSRTTATTTSSSRSSSTTQQRQQHQHHKHNNTTICVQ